MTRLDRLVCLGGEANGSVPCGGSRHTDRGRSGLLMLAKSALNCASDGWGGRKAYWPAGGSDD